MDTSHSRRRTPWLPAMLTSALLVISSAALAAPASADPSPQGQAAPGRSHQPTKPSHPAGTSHPATKAHTTAEPTNHGSTSGSSGVSLARPNDFQAQADPDGMTNGGVDQPGGQGGIDTTSQDGNNGSGNDADCEDDNRGVGVPGHCKDRGDATTAGTPEVPGTPDLPGTAEVPGVPLDTTPDQVLAVVPSVTEVSAPAALPRATGVASATTASPASSATQAAAASSPTVLPNTGAGAALLALALAGLAALALGGGLTRRGRRTA